MFEFLLGIIGNWVAELGSEIPNTVKIALFSDKDLPKYLPDLYYRIFTQTIEKYAQNPDNQEELPILKQFEQLKYWDGQDIEARRTQLIEVLKASTANYKNEHNSIQKTNFTDLLAAAFIDKGIIKGCKKEELALTLQKALQVFPANFFNELGIKQGNYLILQEVYQLGNILPKEDFFSEHFDLFHDKLDTLLQRTQCKSLDKLYITVISPEGWDWKPYQTKTARELVGEFEKEANLITTEMVDFPKFQALTPEIIAEWKCKKREMLILLDTNALQREQKIAEILDDCHLGGLITVNDSFMQQYLPYLYLYSSLPKFAHHEEIETNVLEKKLFHVINRFAKSVLKVQLRKSATKAADID